MIQTLFTLDLQVHLLHLDYQIWMVLPKSRAHHHTLARIRQGRLPHPASLEEAWVQKATPRLPSTHTRETATLPNLMHPPQFEDRVDSDNLIVPATARRLQPSCLRINDDYD